MQAVSQWAYALAVSVLVCLTSGSTAAASDADVPARTHSGVKASLPAAQPAHQAGMRAYFDPKTGKIGPPSPDQAAAAAVTAEENAYNTSAQGLVAVPAPLGGQMVDLQGRFQNTITATLKPDGTVETECNPSGSTPPEAAGR